MMNNSSSLLTKKLSRLPDPIEGHSSHHRSILDNVRKPATASDNNQQQDTSSTTNADNHNKWSSATRLRTPLANRLPASSTNVTSLSPQNNNKSRSTNLYLDDESEKSSSPSSFITPPPQMLLHQSNIAVTALSSPTATLMANVFRTNSLQVADTIELKSRRASTDPEKSNTGKTGISSSTILPPWIPTQVEDTLLFLKKELSAISVLENNISSSPSFDSIQVCLEALNKLAEIATTPVFKPVLELISSTIAREVHRSKNVINVLSNTNESTAQIVALQKKLEETTCSHFTDLLQERKRTKESDAKIEQLKEQFAAVEKEWREKVLDAESDRRVAQLELSEVVQEIDSLREDRNALMSVRKAQEAHVRQVEEHAAKVIEDAERQVGMMKEELESKNRKIKELTTQMKYDAECAKKEFDEYASKALPPVKSAALRAEADRYKLEVKKLKERVEKLVAELQRREAFEPAVPWEDFMEEDMLIKLCNATGIPFVRKEDQKKNGLLLLGNNNNNNSNKRNNTNDDDEEEEFTEEDEARALLVATRSTKFSQQLFHVWRSTESILTRYEAEKELFRTLSQIFFHDVPGVASFGISLDRLQSLTSPSSSAAQFLAHQLLASSTINQQQQQQQQHSSANHHHHHNNSDSSPKARLHLDCPPIDSSSPEPWIDPAWVGCFVQGPKNNNSNAEQEDFFSDLDVPVVCNAEHAFKMVKVIIPPCLMTLSQVKSICVSALVLLGLNRVPDRYDGWHPARHFAHAVKLQLEAAIEDVRNLSANPNAANLPPQAAFYAAGGSNSINNNSSAAAAAANDAFFETSNLFHMSTMLSSSIMMMNNNNNNNKNDDTGGIPYDPVQQAKIYAEIQNHLRRRFVIDEKIWSQIDPKATIAGCMTVLYNRLQEFSASDPFMKLCHSFLLGTRPVLLHARYFALTLRSATQIFSRIEKMLRGTALGGTLPAPLFVQALKPAFGINDSTDISRMSLAAFHTHYWMQMQDNRKAQMDIICPGHDYVETEEEREERKKKEEDEEFERKKRKNAKLKKRQQEKLLRQQQGLTGDDDENHNGNKKSDDDDDDDSDDEAEKKKAAATFGSPAASLALAAKSKTAVSLLDQVLNAVNNATKKSAQQLAKEKETLHILPQYKSIVAWLGNDFKDFEQNQNQTSAAAAGDFSYKKCFGTCWSRSGHGDGNGASPLLLQYCTIYANDVLYCEKIVEDDCIMSFSRATLVSRWSLSEIESAIKLWMSHFRKWKDHTQHASKYYIQLLINQQQADKNAEAALQEAKNNNTNNKKKDGRNQIVTNTKISSAENTQNVELLEEKLLMQTVASLQQTSSFANLTEEENNNNNNNLVSDGNESSSAKAFTAANKNHQTTVAAIANVEMPFANPTATSRIFPFIASGMFDPSEAFHFETVCHHPPLRAPVSFEDHLGVPIHGAESKLSAVVQEGPSLLSALHVAVGIASQSGHNVSTQELVRNILQSHPWHPTLLLRVAAGSWFLMENISSNPDLMVSSIVGLQEMANAEMMNAMNKVLGSGPEIVGKKGKKKK